MNPNSVLARLDKSTIAMEPFPHIIAENALADDHYRALADGYPSLEQVVGSRQLENNKAYLTNAAEVLPDKRTPDVWREFFEHHTSHAYFQEALGFWKEAIDREYPELEKDTGKQRDEITTGLRRKSSELEGNTASDIVLDVQFGVNSPVTEVSRVRGPHVDKPQKLFAGLLYFRREDDESTGGDLGIYRWKSASGGTVNAQYNIDDRQVELVREIRYAPNTLVMWLNTGKSLHGVSPRSITSVPRRYVNFIAESYSLAPGGKGFFDVRRSWIETAAAKVKRAIGMRDV